MTEAEVAPVAPVDRTPLKCFTGAELEALLARRRRIEQAKGMLMLLYGVDDDAAFLMLKEISQAQNAKLHDIATNITAALTAFGLDVAAGRRDAGERLFHQIYLPHAEPLDPAEPRWELRLHRLRKGCVVIAGGELDLSAAPRLRELIVTAGATKRIVLDLVDVEELDEIVALVIVRFERKLMKVKPFKIAAVAGSSVVKTLETVAEAPVQVYPTRHEALQACRLTCGVPAGPVERLP